MRRFVYQALVILAASVLIPAATLAQENLEAAKDNAEITALFEADQADRRTMNPDWEVIGAADKIRQDRTRQLIEAGELKTALDFYYAAFIFQHGREPRSFLLAHALAVRSLALGEPKAEWIAAASLDRYLQKSGGSQIYGTQFLFHDEEILTMGKYDTELLTDTIREASGVGSLEEQKLQLEDMKKRFAPREESEATE